MLRPSARPIACSVPHTFLCRSHSSLQGSRSSLALRATSSWRRRGSSLGRSRSSSSLPSSSRSEPTGLSTRPRTTTTGSVPGSNLSATQRSCDAPTSLDGAEREPTKLDRSGWGPGGRRFKSCLPDVRSGSDRSRPTPPRAVRIATRAGFPLRSVSPAARLLPSSPCPPTVTAARRAISVRATMRAAREPARQAFAGPSRERGGSRHVPVTCGQARLEGLQCACPVRSGDESFRDSSHVVSAAFAGAGRGL